MALEGVHRFAAAAELAIAPELIVLDQDALVEADSLDWQNLQRGQQVPDRKVAPADAQKCTANRPLLVQCLQIHAVSLLLDQVFPSWVKLR
jgi:hypothetical protein